MKINFLWNVLLLSKGYFNANVLSHIIWFGCDTIKWKWQNFFLSTMAKKC